MKYSDKVYGGKKEMSFADELRRSAPSRMELKRQKEEALQQEEAYKERACAEALTKMIAYCKNQSERLNKEGKRRFETSFSLDSHPYNLNFIRPEKRDAKKYATRLSRDLRDALRNEGFKAIVTIDRDFLDRFILKVKIAW